MMMEPFKGSEMQMQSRRLLHFPKLSQDFFITFFAIFLDTFSPFLPKKLKNHYDLQPVLYYHW